MTTCGKPIKNSLGGTIPCGLVAGHGGQCSVVQILRPGVAPKSAEEPRDKREDRWSKQAPPLDRSIAAADWTKTPSAEEMLEDIKAGAEILKAKIRGEVPGDGEDPELDHRSDLGPCGSPDCNVPVCQDHIRNGSPVPEPMNCERAEQIAAQAYQEGWDDRAEGLPLDPQLPLAGPEFEARKDRTKTLKQRWDLLPGIAEAEVVEVLTWSTTKYPEDNWREIPFHSLRNLMYRAARSHMEAHRRGETRDPESGRHPLAHAILSLLFILEQDLAREKRAAEQRAILAQMK